MRTEDDTENLGKRKKLREKKESKKTKCVTYLALGSSAQAGRVGWKVQVFPLELWLHGDLALCPS